MAKIAVSVVIPCYEAAAHLPRAILSALAQTLDPPYNEILVVDDGSSDDVSAVLEPFGGRVTLIRQKHAGVSAARNAGIGAASGDYIAFLDADDYWYPERLEALLACANHEKTAFFTTDFYYEIGGRRESRGYYLKNGYTQAFERSARDEYIQALRGNFLNYMQFVPRSLFALVGSFDETLSYGEEYDLWLRLLSAGIPARLVNRPLAVYRSMGVGSVTAAGLTVKRAKDRVQVLSRHRLEVPDECWLEATGQLSHANLRDALKRRAFGQAARSGGELVRNQYYFKRLLRQRLNWRLPLPERRRAPSSALHHP